METLYPNYYPKEKGSSQDGVRTDYIRVYVKLLTQPV